MYEKVQPTAQGGVVLSRYCDEGHLRAYMSDGAGGSFATTLVKDSPDCQAVEPQPFSKSEFTPPTNANPEEHHEHGYLIKHFDWNGQRWGIFANGDGRVYDHLVNAYCFEANGVNDRVPQLGPYNYEEEQ